MKDVYDITQECTNLRYSANNSSTSPNLSSCALPTSRNLFLGGLIFRSSARDSLAFIPSPSDSAPLFLRRRCLDSRVGRGAYTTAAVAETGETRDLEAVEGVDSVEEVRAGDGGLFVFGFVLPGDFGEGDAFAAAA
ncbi:hypothetical protein KC335_g145 [Hortaea werneckii]|nr:hypothetical protein KC335_g145 [Hortaea werneckii]